MQGADEADVRRSPRAREAGKSDPIDALAVARAAWREPDLPAARLDGPQRELRLLVDHRDDLVRERTRIQSRIRWHLHEIDPTLQVRSRGLRSQTRRRPGRSRQLQAATGTIVEIVREQLARVRELNQRALELERQITLLVDRDLLRRCLQIPGCGALTAAKIVGETAGARRFRSKSAYARWNGTAPQPVWSGNTTRYRLARSGNRQVNSALHRIAITQARIADARTRLHRAHGSRGQHVAPRRCGSCAAASPTSSTAPSSPTRPLADHCRT